MNILSDDINSNIVLKRIALAAVFLISVVFLLSLERAAPHLEGGARFQEWSSDAMFQDLSSTSLREHPFKSLWYLHQEPPLFDAIRGMLIQTLPLSERGSIDNLDKRIYMLWVLAFGLMAALVFHWLARLTGLCFAFCASLLWALHPSPIFYATYLNATFLIALEVLWLFYELWKVYRGSSSITRLFMVTFLMFYTRVTFHACFLFLLFFSLWLMHLPRRKLAAFVVVSMLFAAPFMIKQYAVFRITSTTILGQNMYFLVAGNDPLKAQLPVEAVKVPYRYPSQARVSEGYYNTEDNWRENLAYHQLAGRYLRAHPWGAIKNVIRTFFIYNWPDYWRPSSEFRQNTAVAFLPWSAVFNGYLGYPINALFLVLALAIWVKGRRGEGLAAFDGRALGLWLPGIYIFLTSTLVNTDGKGWTEAVRYKFFLEPVFYVLVASQFYVQARFWFCAKIKTNV